MSFIDIRQLLLIRDPSIPGILDQINSPSPSAGLAPPLQQITAWTSAPIYPPCFQSGIGSETDSQAVLRITKVHKAKIINEAYIFREPVSPHWAAEIDHKVINFQLLNLPNVDGSLIIETAGGLMVPITRNFLQIDLIKKKKY